MKQTLEQKITSKFEIPVHRVEQQIFKCRYITAELRYNARVSARFQTEEYKENFITNMIKEEYGYKLK